MALQQRQLVLLYLVVFLYAACFMAQAPLLPYMVKQLGADASYYGLLQSSFSGLQLAGSLLSGPLVDRYGGRALLLLSFGSSALCYVLTASATSIHMLFVSRLATLLQHAVLAARSLIAHSCPEADRAALLGRLGAAYGLGFALGPAAGGLLSSRGLAVTAWAAAGGSLLAMGLVALGLPDDAPASTNTATSSSSASSSSKSSSIKSSGSAPKQQPQGSPRLSLSSLAAVTAYPGVPALLLMQGGANLAGALLQSTFALVLQQRFQLSSRGNGLVLSWVGLCVATAQALVIKPLSSRLGEAASVKLSSGLLGVTFLAIGACSQLWQLLLCLVPLSVGSVTISTINTARLSKSVPKAMAGTVMALDMSLGSGLRTLSPLLGTLLNQQHGFQAVCAAAAAVLLSSFGTASLLQAGGSSGKEPGQGNGVSAAAAAAVDDKGVRGVQKKAS